MAGRQRLDAAPRGTTRENSEEIRLPLSRRSRSFSLSLCERQLFLPPTLREAVRFLSLPPRFLLRSLSVRPPAGSSPVLTPPRRQPRVLFALATRLVPASFLSFCRASFLRDDRAALSVPPRALRAILRAFLEVLSPLLASAIPPPLRPVPLPYHRCARGFCRFSPTATPAAVSLRHVPRARLPRSGFDVSFRTFPFLFQPPTPPFPLQRARRTGRRRAAEDGPGR